MKQIIGLAKMHKLPVVMASIDYRSAFNGLDVPAIMAILRDGFGIPDVDVIERLYTGAYFQVSGKQGETAKIPLTRGTRQGCCLSPLIFTICLNCLMRRLEKH